jgi:hypothetical protein
LRGSAPAIWSTLAAGASFGDIVRRLERAYEAPTGEIAAAVEGFLQELERERLIAAADGSPSPPPELVPEERGPFEPPQLEKYEDLQDIILLDPVHMVDDRGWPHPAPVEGSAG